jgi:hypothetical protein
MSAPARFRQADVERVIKAARKCGFYDVRVSIDANGRIEAILGTAANDAPPVELE